ncbi:hypothetical protein AMECASPLE_035769 [Ameca splendens]|uniref:Uncharacterized protein n=1 Tax=Ameca splendens TaxID=208324 RepID=A0ABV0ZSH2_9TELE
MTPFPLEKGDFDSKLLSQLIRVSQLELMEFLSKTDLPHYRMKTRKKNPSSKNNTRYENNLHTNQSSPKLPEKERPTRSRTLIMGNTAVNGIKNFGNRKNTEVMNGNGNMVSNISENILVFKEERQTLENLIIHFGAMDDVAKKNMYWRI